MSEYDILDVEVRCKVDASLIKKIRSIVGFPSSRKVYRQMEAVQSSTWKVVGPVVENLRINTLHKQHNK